MSKIATAAIIFGMLWSTAEAFSGIELQGLCSVGRPDCDSFVLGVTQGIILGQANLRVGNNYCVPDDVTEAQLQQILLKYLREHPEQLHRPAANLVAEAVYTAFPCRKSN